jgi:YD repeat-containing protein
MTAGNLVAETGALGRRLFEYDAANRLTKVTNDDLSTRSFTRDFRGNILTETDELGRGTRYEYEVSESERETGLGPATLGLGSRCSAN